MTLLQKLTSALNKVDGNYMTHDDDSKYDEYYCTICKRRVYEESYNQKQSVCYECFYKGD